MAAGEGLRAAIPLRRLAFELYHGKRYSDELERDLNTIILHEDNQACIKAITRSRLTPKLRHLRVRLHWIRELYHEDKYFEPVYVSSQEQIADMRTKSLNRSDLDRLKTLLRMGSVNVRNT